MGYRTEDPSFESLKVTESLNELVKKFDKKMVGGWIEGDPMYDTLSDKNKHPKITVADIRKIALLRVNRETGIVKTALASLKNEVQANVATSSTSIVSSTIIQKPPEKISLQLDYTKAKAGTEKLLMDPKTQDGVLNEVPGMSGVAFIKYKDPTEMNKRFGKITAYVEQGAKDFKESKSWNYAGGHDLSSESIADFFNKKLGDKKEAQYFIDNKLISKTNSTYAAIPNKAILVMSYDNSMSDERKEITASSIPHELAHGLYFTNPEFKALTESVWNGLPENQKKALSEMLKKNYQNEAFHATEFLSYILFTGDKATVIDNLVGYGDIDKKNLSAKNAYIEKNYNEIILPLKKTVSAKIESMPNLSPAIKSFIDSNKV